MRREWVRHDGHRVARCEQERERDAVANEKVSADIRLVPRRLSVIAGTVVGSNGRPLSGGELQLGMGPPLFGLGGLVMPIESDGSFATPPLAPGKYSLQTSDGRTARAMSGVPDPVMSGARVTLRDTCEARLQSFFSATGT